MAFFPVELFPLTRKNFISYIGYSQKSPKLVTLVITQFSQATGPVLKDKQKQAIYKIIIIRLT